MTSRARWAGVLRTPVGAAAAVLLGAVLLLAVLAPLLWGGRADEVDTAHILAPASAEHWAGTDNLGRDIFFRVLVATRTSVRLALLATAVGVAVGLLLGTLPLLLGPRLGRLVTAAVNIAVAFPGLLLALSFAVIFGAGASGAVPAIGLAIAPAFARLTQTLAASVAGRDFVAAARIAGVGRVRVLLRHVLPNIAEPLLVNATMAAGGSLLAFAGLSFLGLGVQAPDYDWGRLLGEGLNGIYLNPAAALVPGVAVVLAGLAFNLVGEAAAKAVGPRTATAGGRKRATDDARPTPTPTPTPTTAVPVRPQQSAQADALLIVEDLKVSFGPVTPVRGVGFTLGRGEAVGIVGSPGPARA
ncbi:ABC transporter permease subunit [Catellatospora coxensis]